MTAPLSFTKASIQRRIRAAKAEGLRVKGIAPDGTVLVDDGDRTPEPDATLAPDEAARWADVKA